MSWIKQNDNLYIHDQAPYSLVLSNGIWFVIDNRDQSKSIPFDDILNNPVFPADFSNQTISARHFRGQSIGDLASPPHSFQGEINSGLYRESAGVLAFAVLGNKVLTINSIPSFLCKAWVSFDGSVASPTPSGSGNISSITKNSTGDYIITFQTPMPDANYSIYMSSKQSGANLGSIGYPVTKLTNSFRFTFVNSDVSPSARDQSEVNLGIFR